MTNMTEDDEEIQSYYKVVNHRERSKTGKEKELRGIVQSDVVS